MRKCNFVPHPSASLMGSPSGVAATAAAAALEETGQHLHAALDQAIQQCPQKLPSSIKRRILTAADLLQDRPEDITPYMDPSENLENRLVQDRPLVKEWAVEALFQLLTVLAICSLAFAVGIIIGSIMCRTTLFSGSALINVHSASKSTSTATGDTEAAITLLLPESDTWKDGPPDVIAVLTGRFIMELPEYCLGSYAEALSAVLTLSYLPAGNAGLSAEACFPDVLPPPTLVKSQKHPRASPQTSRRRRRPASVYHLMQRLAAISAGYAIDTLRSIHEREGLVDAAGSSSIFSRAGSASADLIKRAIENLSLLSRARSTTGRPLYTPTYDPVVNAYVDESRLILQHSAAPFPSELLHEAAQQQRSIGPTLLVRSILPFVVGLTHGLNSVSVLAGVNVPLIGAAAAAVAAANVARETESGGKQSRAVAQARRRAAGLLNMGVSVSGASVNEEELRNALIKDCGLGRVYFELEVSVQAVRAMFFKQTHGKRPMAPFRVKCTIERVTNETAWPPPPPQAFIDDVAGLAAEYTLLSIGFASSP